MALMHEKETQRDLLQRLENVVALHKHLMIHQQRLTGSELTDLMAGPLSPKVYDRRPLATLKAPPVALYTPTPAV